MSRSTFGHFSHGLLQKSVTSGLLISLYVTNSLVQQCLAVQAPVLAAITGNSPPPKDGKDPPILNGICNFRGINPCVEEATCKPSVPLVGEAVCICKDGFGGDGMRPDLGGTGCQDINECIVPQRNTCISEGQICQNTFGSFRCLCRDGYDLAPDGSTCLDVDECRLSRLNSCDPLSSRCINTSGSYKCECLQPNQIVDHKTLKCRDRDECTDENGAMNPCSQICINRDPGVECACQPGWELAPDGRQCIDIDECSTNQHTCDPTGRVSNCVNQPGTYSCSCNNELGYQDAPDGKSCTNLNECDKYAYVCGGPDTCCKDLPPPARFACISPQGFGLFNRNTSPVNGGGGIFRTTQEPITNGLLGERPYQSGRATGVVGAIMGVDTTVPTPFSANEEERFFFTSDGSMRSTGGVTIPATGLNRYMVNMQQLPNLPPPQQLQSLQQIHQLQTTYPAPLTVNPSAYLHGASVAPFRDAQLVEQSYTTEEETVAIPVDDFASIAMAAATALGCFETGVKIVDTQEEYTLYNLMNNGTNNIPSAFGCQMLCFSTEGCEYFSFSISTGECKMFKDYSTMSRVDDATIISGPRHCGPRGNSASLPMFSLRKPDENNTYLSGMGYFDYLDSDASTESLEKEIIDNQPSTKLTGIIFDHNGPVGHLLDGFIPPSILENVLTGKMQPTTIAQEFLRAILFGVVSKDNETSLVNPSETERLGSSFYESFLVGLKGHPCENVPEQLLCYTPPLAMPLTVFRSLVASRFPGLSLQFSLLSNPSSSIETLSNSEMKSRRLQVLSSATRTAGRLGNSLTNNLICPDGFSLGSDVYKGQIRSQTRKAIRAIASGTAVDQYGNEVRATPEHWTRAVVGNTNKAATGVSRWYGEIASVPADMMAAALSSGVPTSPAAVMHSFTNPGVLGAGAVGTGGQHLPFSPQPYAQQVLSDFQGVAQTGQLDPRATALAVGGTAVATGLVTHGIDTLAFAGGPGDSKFLDRTGKSKYLAYGLKKFA